jgi:heparosan-N-sulfate-glucuronate 5-epimerase
MSRRDDLSILDRIKRRKNYLRRIFASYIFSRNSQLTFWHEVPAVNEEAFSGDLGQYYMTFEQKAHYPGPFDANGIPQLDYHGELGRQHNPIAVAQYALGNYNLYKRVGDASHYDRFLANSEWLADNLTVSPEGTYLWPHNFDFEYFRTLKAPWFSGLAQGQGLSVLTRAYAETEESRYLTLAEEAFDSLTLFRDQGGVLERDSRGYLWIEEYLVDPPTHILNGFIWALWGIHDYYLLTGDSKSKTHFETFTKTILDHLDRYDTGFWSYYELTPQRIKSIASRFYHHLHIVQLDVMFRLTGNPEFARYATKWKDYTDCRMRRTAAKVYKIAFKLVYY